MSLGHFVAVLLAGCAAGTINTIVGSGSLITFPTLLALGYSPLVANVSNNIGLVPGSLSGAIGYRRELAGQRRRLARLVPASALGALVGSTLLLVLPSDVFDNVVVVLVIAALVLVVTGPMLSKRLAARRAARAGEHRDVTPLLWALVAAAGVYGGYFGAAQGIILISVLGILIDDGLQHLNATKNVLALTVNGVAAVVFIATTEVNWAVAGTIAIGATAGGQIGARYGRRLDPRLLRGVIVVVGLTAVLRLLGVVG
ncbi:MAG: sulfite exporter TauE/SafE family protein [Ilumatobacteraceae bacterium]